MMIRLPRRRRTIPGSTRAATTAVAVALACALSPASSARAQGGAPGDSATAWLGDIELLYSASRYAQDAREAPVAATIITRDEIRALGYRTLGDLLASVRSFAMRYDHNYEYVSVGGLARQGDFNARLLVLVDGHRINGVAADVAGSGTEALVDLELIDRVEVIRGPGSALFGTNAFFGVVNIITLGARDQAGLRLFGEGGTAGVARGGITWSAAPRPNVEFLASAVLQQRRGRDWYFPEFDAPATNGGVAEGLDGERTHRLFAKGRWGDLEFHAAHSFRWRDVPTASYETRFNDPYLRTRDGVGTGGLTYTRVFADLSRVITSATYTRNWYQGDYPYDGSLLNDYDEGGYWTLDAQYLRVVGDGHKLTVGAESRLGHGRLGVFDLAAPGAPRIYQVDVDRHINVLAAFAQAEWRLGERAILYTGLRHDDYGQEGSATTPRVAFVLRPAERTTLKLTVGSAFRAPNIYELAYDDGATQKPPAALVPERLSSIEVSAEQRMGGLTAAVAIYSMDTHDLIDLREDPADSLLVFANVGNPRSLGVEVELRGRIGPATGRAAVTAVRAREADGSRPVDSPRVLARAGVQVPVLAGRGTVGFEVRHLGARLTPNGDEAPAQTLVNLQLLWRPRGDATEFFAGIKDLFDVAPPGVPGVEHLQVLLPQEGRTFRAGVRLGIGGR